MTPSRPRDLDFSDEPEDEVAELQQKIKYMLINYKNFLKTIN